MTDSRTFKYFLLIMLTLTNSIQSSFQITAWPAIQRSSGFSLAVISILQAIGVISLFSFLWSPLIDRVGWQRFGHYRSWLLGLQLLVVVGIVAMVGFDPVQPLDKREALSTAARLSNEQNEVSL